MELENMNEIRNDEAMVDIENYDEIGTETEEKSGLSTLAAMAIGAGVTAAAIGVVGLVKKGIKKVKAKKANSAKNESCEDCDEDCIEIDEADVEVK